MVAVPRLPRVSNFDDLDPLRAEPDVAVLWIEPGEPLPANADLVLLPGSKSTIGDLEAFIAAGWDIDLKAHVRRGGRVVGLCGGYQMLGRRIEDPEGVEGKPGAVDGLGLLDVQTILAGEKSLEPICGRDRGTGEIVRGYEMHIGRTSGEDCRRPMLDLGGKAEGAVSPDGRVMGCYVHGLFAADAFRHRFLSGLRARARSGIDYERSIETVLDDLASRLEQCLDICRIEAIANA
jgi:adenosylcobyric acid synthase